MTIMCNPPHPGEILKEIYVEPLDLSITQAAKDLDVTRQTLSDLINCRSGISVEMALRLSKAFDTTPQFWLNLQNTYDLWTTSKRKNFENVLSITKSKSAHSLTVAVN